MRVFVMFADKISVLPATTMLVDGEHLYVYNGEDLVGLYRVEDVIAHISRNESEERLEYSFNVDIAQMYGVEESIFIHNLYFWILKNEANGRHWYEGRHWTYNSMAAFSELFPFWTTNQMRRIISNCVAKGAVIKGNFNKSNYDRTTWYALSETVTSIYANRHFDLLESTNGSAQITHYTR